MQIFSYSHIGQKSDNEDAHGIGEYSYVVCDGVGGANKGEIASKVICEFLVDALKKPVSSPDEISRLIKEGINELNSKVNEHPEFDGTATTLAGIFINSSQGIYTAHIGDSRIFLVRPSNKKFWHTWDHSLVGDLVKNGEISREEGRVHPMNNRIYRALKNGLIDNNPEPEIHLISDLRKGDRILICSDGVLEAYSDLEIIELLCNKDFSIENIGNQMKDVCSIESRDNNTAIILEVENGDFKVDQTEKLEWSSLKSLKRENQKIKSKLSIRDWAKGIWSGRDHKN
ncbi:PP2C family protein-serine/threonine phosphatase [Christiangramia echinicola]|uniref:PP2C family protein-serine/threonine phosphatase n=1 Tax=Christiangramia echinicola TaxID=279359 RepID=UPI0004096E61|nr:PP2C family serine/threonine-protein phosphatase [Christiangramia echinicola]